jgi:hypothetical protein
MKLGTSLLGLLLVGAAPLLHAGCNSTPSSSEICDKACACQEGCKNNQKAECVSEVDEEKQKADQAGCSSEFDDFLDCANGLSCKNRELDAEGECGATENALEACIKGGNGVPVKNTCDLAVDRIEKCAKSQSSGSGTGMTDCTGVVECQAECILAASCGALTGKNSEDAKFFADCVQNCAD